MNLFYAKPNLIRRPLIQLEGSEADHALKVLRYREGDEIHLTDGLGTHFTARVSKTGRGHLWAEIISEEIIETAGPQVTILIGLIRKRDRLEFAVEKCVELGADRVLLFRGDHSEKQNVRMDRIESTILSAMKQSLRFTLPVTGLFNNLKDALEAAGDGKLIMADETVDEGKIEPIVKGAAINLNLIVGPEGGYSQKERSILIRAGVEAYSLGAHRLRTETAALIMVDRFSGRRRE